MSWKLLRIVPALELKFTQPLYLVREDEDLQLNLNVKVNSNKPYRKGVLNLMYNGERLGGADVSLNNGKDITINTLFQKPSLLPLIRPVGNWMPALLQMEPLLIKNRY